MKIRMDDGVTKDCPVRESGIATVAECEDCEHVLEMDGPDVICVYGAPIGNETLDIELELDLDTLAEAIHWNMHIRHRAQNRVITKILQAMTPEERGKIEQYRRAPCTAR